MRTNLIARLTFPFLATSILAVAPACDEDVVMDADFARASQEQRQIAIATATGETAGAAIFLTAIFAELGEDGSCPKVTRSGDKVTIKGGCSVDDGRIEGSATFEGDEDDGEFSVSWDNFKITDEDSTLRIDGSLTVTAKGQGGEIDADVDFEIDGKGGKLDGVLTCDASERCTADSDTYVTVKGLGSAAVKGTWSTGDEDGGVRSGAIELFGKNVLKLDFSKPTSEGCYAATVDGAPVAPLCEDIDDDDTFEATAKRAAKSFQNRATR